MDSFTDYYLLHWLYNSPYYTALNHKTYFNNVNVPTFLEKFNINTNTCKNLNQVELRKQLKLLHFLIHTSYPLVDNRISVYDQFHNIKGVKLLCRRYEMPLHEGAWGDAPHFTLEIKTHGGPPMTCHLYLSGLLTANSLVLSSAQPLEYFDHSVRELKRKNK